MTVAKEVQVIDPQLFVSSSNKVRDALGDSINSDGQNKYIEHYFFYKDTTTSYDGLKKIYTYPHRIIGNASTIKNDKEWLKFISGGQFSDMNFAGITTSQTFTDHKIGTNLPYSVIEAKNNNSFSTLSPEYISIKPVLNDYYDRFDVFLNELSSVTEIPNAYYLLSSLDDPDAETTIDLHELYRFKIPNETFAVDQNAKLQKNILFASTGSYEELFDRENFLFRIPHYNQIEFNFDSTNTFGNLVETYDFGHRLIKSLKDTFLGEDGSISPSQKTFVLKTQALNENQEIETSQSNVDLKLVDAFGILEYSLLDYNTENSNFDYFLDNSQSGKSQYNSNSVLRYDKTYTTLKMLESFKELVENVFTTSVYEPFENQFRTSEVVAYRIEKIGGEPTGDSFTQRTVQNFWLLNSDSVERFMYADSQVVYGQTYTYRVYKYILILGVEYKYSDFVASRTIGKLESNRFCVEMFDPETGISRPSPFNNSTGDAIAIENDLETGAQLNSFNQYLSDFLLTIGPSAKIVEVPMLTKEVTILDAPPPAPMVMPFFQKNNSQRIGFNIKLDVAVNKRFPTTIGASEALYKEKFLTSYDLTPNEEFFAEDVSLPQTIQMLRISQRPNSLADFEVSTAKIKNMMIPNNYQTYRDTTIYDKIETNRKYFYLFRVLNEVGSPAFSSPIFEAELVSDGGYKFAVFESYVEEDLGDKKFSNPIMKFKKLINIVPNINNFMVNQDGADFSRKAEEQKNNITFGASDKELVWGKTFKLRLTSKQTGKKIDINLTYKQDG